MSVPPLDRIADVFVDHRAVDAGVRSLRAYDELLGILDDGDQRAPLSELSAAEAAQSRVGLAYQADSACEGGIWKTSPPAGNGRRCPCGMR
jgi:hypothetical protein